MTLLQVIRAIEGFAIAEPSVAMVIPNDVFRLNATPDAKYGVFAWTQQQHTLAEDLLTFGFAFFYVDRLNEDGGNEVEIQSVGVQTLSDILRQLEDAGVFPVGETTFQTFNQRFMDECAGVWCNVRLQVPVNWVCPQDFTPETGNDFSNDFSNDF